MAPSDFSPADHVVFVVDGDTRYGSEISVLLNRIGYGTRIFSTAEDVLANLEESPVPACVISEMSLPGMSGLELTQELRERHIESPVIILTRQSDVATAVNALRSSVADYLIKPFVERDLVDRLRLVITRHHAGVD